MHGGFAAVGVWVPLGPWIVPVMGLATCVLAYVVGRVLLSGSKGETALGDLANANNVNFLQGVTRERRGAPRRKGNAVEVLLLLGDDQEPIPGLVQDRSIGGLGILLEQPLPTNAVLKVRPRQASESTPWTEVTVRSCRRDGLQYEIGLQFHRTPNWNLLLQFG